MFFKQPPQGCAGAALPPAAPLAPRGSGSWGGWWNSTREAAAGPGLGLSDPDTLDDLTWRSRCCCRKCFQGTERCRHRWTSMGSPIPECPTFLFFVKNLIVIFLYLSRKYGWLEMWNFSVWTGYLYIFLTSHDQTWVLLSWMEHVITA